MVQSILAKMISSGFGSRHLETSRFFGLLISHPKNAAVGGAEVIPVTSSVCAKCSETWKPGDRLATGPFSAGWSRNRETGGWCNQ